MQLTSQSALSGVNDFAVRSADALILIGRILLTWVFVGSAYTAIMNFGGSQAYFRALNVPAPELFALLTLVAEVVISASLILGIGTRYGTILAFVFVVMATAIGHRYWEYPPGPQQVGQYINFLKNISILGGIVAIFVTGAGRFSVDRRLGI
jgi:putative oxidoreductase